MDDAVTPAPTATSASAAATSATASTKLTTAARPATVTSSSPSSPSSPTTAAGTGPSAPPNGTVAFSGCLPAITDALLDNGARSLSREAMTHSVVALTAAFGLGTVLWIFG